MAEQNVQRSPAQTRFKVFWRLFERRGRGCPDVKRFGLGALRKTAGRRLRGCAGAALSPSRCTRGSRHTRKTLRHCSFDRADCPSAHPCRSPTLCKKGWHSLVAGTIKRAGTAMAPSIGEAAQHLLELVARRLARGGQVRHRATRHAGAHFWIGVLGDAEGRGARAALLQETNAAAARSRSPRSRAGDPS